MVGKVEKGSRKIMKVNVGNYGKCNEGWENVQIQVEPENIVIPVRLC